MTTDERIDKLARTVEDFERVVRQGFATLTELHADTQREIAGTQREVQKMANAISALTDHIADHGTRLDNLEGK